MEHKELVKKLCKSGAVIKEEITAQQAHDIHMSLGIAGEAGELVDAIKKYAIYQKPVDRGHVVEEMGDLEFYLEGLRQSLGITREEVLKYNVDKLLKRYKGAEYSNQAAIDRADKNESN